MKAQTLNKNYFLSFIELFFGIIQNEFSICSHIVACCRIFFAERPSSGIIYINFQTPLKLKIARKTPTIWLDGMIPSNISAKIRK